MIRVLLAILLVLPLRAQFTSTAQYIIPATSLPALCSASAGQVQVVFSAGTATPYYCSTTNNWTAMGGSATVAFGSLTSGTNTTAAMVVGNGASLGWTGTGTIDASTLAGSAIGTSGATIGLLNASLTFGGADTFGNGSSLTYSGSGTINATTVAGNAIGTSGATIGLLNANLTFSGADTFAASSSLDFAANNAAFKNYVKAPWVSDTDGICAGATGCVAGGITASGSNTDASFATNISVPQNTPATNRVIRARWGFDTSMPGSPVNATYKLNACLTTNFTAGASTTCSSGGVVLWQSSSSLSGTASITKPGVYECEIEGGGSNTLYTTCINNGSTNPVQSASSLVKSTFASMASGAWTLYWTVQYVTVPTSNEWIRQTSGVTEYLN